MAKRVHLSEEEIIKDRLAYVGTLAGGLAHEVRSPLNSIHLNVELLEKAGCHLQGPEEAAFHRKLARIKEEVSNLQKTLTEFLQFAHPPSIELLPTFLKDFLYDIVEFIEPELKQEGIRITLEAGEHPYPVLMDRRQMGQVVLNLIFNARDAVKQAGACSITVRSAEEEQAVRIEIEDDGCGIDDEIQPRIFDAFFTTKERGTGLGLGIVRRIVYEHGGSIDVRSPLKQGRGSLFTVRLPKEKLLDRASGGEDPA